MTRLPVIPMLAVTALAGGLATIPPAAAHDAPLGYAPPAYGYAPAERPLGYSPYSPYQDVVVERDVYAYAPPAPRVYGYGPVGPRAPVAGPVYGYAPPVAGYVGTEVGIVRQTRRPLGVYAPRTDRVLPQSRDYFRAVTRQSGGN